MVNPQKERGYVGIANEIWDELVRRDFTKRQKDILLFILRLSYGCGRKSANVPRQRDFQLCGVRESHIKKELEYLILSGVIIRDGYEFQLVKNYERWRVPIVSNFDDEQFKELIHINLQEAKKERQELTKTGSDEMNLIDDETYQNGKISKKGNLPKQEVFEGTEKVGELTEMVSSQEKNLPKREVGLTEMVSSTPENPLHGAVSEPSKKDLKKEKIKESNNIYVEIISYLNEKTGKNFRAKTVKTIASINGRISDGYSIEDFKHVIDVKTAEWLNDPRMNQYLCPDTLFRPSNFEKYVNQQMPNSKGGTNVGKLGSGHQGYASGGSVPTRQSSSRISEEQFDSLGIGH